MWFKGKRADRLHYSQLRLIVLDVHLTQTTRVEVEGREAFAEPKAHLRSIISFEFWMWVQNEQKLLMFLQRGASWVLQRLRASMAIAYFRMLFPSLSHAHTWLLQMHFQYEQPLYLLFFFMSSAFILLISIWRPSPGELKSVTLGEKHTTFHYAEAPDKELLLRRKSFYHLQWDPSTPVMCFLSRFGGLEWIYCFSQGIYVILSDLCKYPAAAGQQYTENNHPFIKHLSCCTNILLVKLGWEHIDQLS